MLDVVSQGVGDRAHLNSFEVQQALVGQKAGDGTDPGGANGHGTGQTLANPFIDVVFADVILKAGAGLAQTGLKMKKILTDVAHCKSPLC